MRATGDHMTRHHMKAPTVHSSKTPDHTKEMDGCKIRHRWQETVCCYTNRLDRWSHMNYWIRMNLRSPTNRILRCVLRWPKVDAVHCYARSFGARPTVNSWMVNSLFGSYQDCRWCSRDAELTVSPSNRSAAPESY